MDNLTDLRSLLAICPNCAQENDCEICTVLKNEQFTSYLLELYKIGVKEDINPEEYFKQERNTNKEACFKEFIGYIQYLNTYLKNNNVKLENPEIIEYIDECLNCIFPTSKSKQAVEASKSRIQKSTKEIIENIKKDNDIYNIIDTLVFDVRDMTFFKQVFENYYSYFRKHLKDKKNIEGLVGKYIELVKDEENEERDLIAIAKIISYIINNKKLAIKSKVEKKCHQILYNVSSSLNSKKYSPHERKRMARLLKILIDNINNKEIVTEEQFDANINAKYGIKPNFSEQALKELENLKVVNDKLYVDLTNKYIISIDKSAYSCPDDAFSIEILPNGNYLFGIYITDVYSYINEGGALEFEAFDRSQTIYCLGKTIHMLPEKLLYNTLSLASGGKKYVIACLFELAPSFDLINYEIKRAIISLDDKKNFGQVKRDVKRGKNVEFNNVYCYETLLRLSSYIKKHNPILSRYHKDFDGLSSVENMVESFMFYYNYNIEKKYKELDIPCIYKGFFVKRKLFHPENTKRSLVEYIIDGLSNHPMGSFYTIDNNKFKSPNIRINMVLTTPIRNFASLQNQKLVQKYLIDKEKITDSEIYELEEKLKIISNHMNEKDKIIREYVEEYNYYKIKEYKKKKS